MIRTELFVKMVIDRWNGSILNLNNHLNTLTDEQLAKEINIGKNSGRYLLGHLIAVHDEMLILLDMGEKLFPELLEPFIKQADKAATQSPSVAELREMWEKQNAHLQAKFEKMEPEEWFEKHTAVSEENFAKEPQRNKLNIIITRTSHLQYHSGQIVLLN
ncbi:DinB family protein [Lacihabitans sp. CS3-21]|uniref:DinB family protein n=1 Tax=Lacihabitans sp. CS3-21 TaxID=2487332 RepID=UPI0020CE2668|nr:DinB family protein [Lacihabitans sp. CS3-21]MCP9748912.1 DinB family protein [Lacihabitans sp. CS3-21]